MVLRSQIFFDSHFYNQYFSMFRFLFATEILSSIFLLGGIPFFIFGVMKKRKIHRNIRIIICHIWFRYGTAIVGRLILIYYQIFSINWTDSDMIFSIANLMRGSFTGYLTSFMLCIAFERYIATCLWNWYEKQRNITISIAVISLSIVEILGNIAAYLYAYELLTIQQHYILMFGYALGSTVCIVLVCVINLRIMTDLRRGARIDSYSINRTYQIRENLKVIENLIQFVGPTVILNIPCFLFYGLYAFLPESLNTYRYFGAEFYDICTILYGLAYTIIMIFSRNKMRKLWNFRLLDLTGKESAGKNSSSEGDVYFMQLSAQFELQSTK